jgi:hypothetical protein
MVHHAGGMSFFSFDIIVAAANFLYSLGMLLEFTAFVWLCVKQPGPRPYIVPARLPAAVVLCLVPSAFLVFVMAIAGWKVYAISAAFTAVGVAVYYLIRFCKARGCLRFSNGGDHGTAAVYRMPLYLHKLFTKSINNALFRCKAREIFSLSLHHIDFWTHT